MVVQASAGRSDTGALVEKGAPPRIPPNRRQCPNFVGLAGGGGLAAALFSLGHCRADPAIMWPGHENSDTSRADAGVHAAPIKAPLFN